MIAVCTRSQRHRAGAAVLDTSFYDSGHFNVGKVLDLAIHRISV